MGTTASPSQSELQVGKRPLTTTAPTRCFSGPSPSPSPTCPQKSKNRRLGTVQMIQEGESEGEEAVWLWSRLGCVIREKAEVTTPPAGHQNITRPFLCVPEPAPPSSLYLSPEHLGGKRRNSVKKPDVDGNPYQTSACLANVSCRWPSVFWKWVAHPTPAH